MKQWAASFVYCLLCVGGILLSTAFLYQIFENWELLIVLRTALFTITGISLFLCVWFKQDQPFFLLFITIIAYLLIDYFSGHQHDSNYYTLVAYPLMCILYPINICILTQTRHHTFFLPTFIQKIVILAVEIVSIYFLTYFIPSLFGETVNICFQENISKIFNFSFGLLSDFQMAIPPISFLVFMGCFAYSIFKANSKFDYLHCAYLAVFFLTFLSFYFISVRGVPTSLFLAGIGCVLLALLQTSHTMAFLDELTNIPGRRALMSTLLQYDKQLYTLAMIDIDFFKRLNDSYGHEVGDQGLRMISARLVELSKTGHLYRYGGEEFVLLFLHRKLEEVLDEIEETREIISTSDFFLRPHKKSIIAGIEKYPYMASIKITLSIGVSEKRPGESPEDVMNIADQALYKAKQTGRNKTVYNKNGKFYELF